MKTQHYWDIHRRVANVIWGELPDYLKAIIASDSEHVTRHFHAFNDKVNGEAERLFQDENYHYTRKCYPDRWDRLVNSSYVEN